MAAALLFLYSTADHTCIHTATVDGCVNRAGDQKILEEGAHEKRHAELRQNTVLQ